MPTSWRLDPDATAAALAMLRGARHVLLPTHQHVDADSISSAMAMSRALERFGVASTVLVSDGQLPGSLRFLPGVERVARYGVDPLPDYDLLCLIDSSDLRRLGTFYRDDPSRVDGRIPMVNIDHHVTNDRFGVVNIVEPGAASASEIVADILAAWAVELDRETAQLLLSGIYGDTLGLRTDSVTSRTMRTAADLVDAGANPVPIVDALFRIKPQSTVRLWRIALRKIEWTGSLIWTALTEEDFTAAGAESSEAEGIVNFLLGTEESHAAAILYGTSDGWRVSMRSMNQQVDVAKICAVFGGGGHPRAAGCQVEGGEEEKRAFVERVAELLAEIEITGVSSPSTAANQA
ncbi:MAG: bifunctional oligoribonuclease/PAP phosphatase NrnA [Thermomicrobiales bacterium]